MTAPLRCEGIVSKHLGLFHRHARSERGEGFARRAVVVSYRTAYCSGVETDPQMRSDAVFGLRMGPISLQSLQDRERCTTCPQRRIFECDRGAEDRHNAVAGKAKLPELLRKD
jgi:hypothetical protein